MSAATAMPADIARWATKAVGPISEVRDASHERVNSRVRKGPRAQRGPVLREGRTRAGVLHQGDLRLPARGRRRSEQARQRRSWTVRLIFSP